jgi:hypothetical protein
MNTLSHLELDGRPRRSVFVAVLWFFVGYWVLSCVTLPFLDKFWFGEIPLLAIFQIPKIAVADWLRMNVVMKWIEILGLSSGSFSPDYILARPYALALAYLVLVAVLGAFARVSRFRLAEQRRVVGAFFLMAIVDYFMTLGLAGGPGFSIYG